MILKFLQKGTILYYSSVVKQDSEIAEPVWPTVLEIEPHSGQERAPEPPKMVLLNYLKGFEFGDLKKPQVIVSTK